MKIILENIGRRFNREWIFRNVNYTFENDRSYAILGANGSGKSTLLQVISGSLTSSEGTLCYRQNDITIDIENIFPELSLAAPYLDLIEEFSLSEHIDFHFQFKKYRDGYDKKALISLLNLQQSEHKSLKYFSSGMKQRVKLALAFCSDTRVLLLDEPTSNLDLQGVEWYLSLIRQFSKDRLVIVCSNQEHEYAFCEDKIVVTDYK
ncbi:ABC transporter ATP-binding protein [Daejeonella lutea]|uniref:ABC-type multidrug transport system, ATPase component n=1 Tax=Daejeonella lutea TaxID=572036 RepID=A0A1T5DM52_9SPHI|nr:ATP-binding cassette domain-containing protein [Daejeonella lutea]SKB72543.1 ABC-type multidrug transport system, ATPase component [Daejeonella lutea]